MLLCSIFYYHHHLLGMTDREQAAIRHIKFHSKLQANLKIESIANRDDKMSMHLIVEVEQARKLQK